jgi:hypothetical protein
MTKEFLLHKEKEEKRKPIAHSGTFGCPNTLATTSQPKEPSFCRRSQKMTIFTNYTK